MTQHTLRESLLQPLTQIRLLIFVLLLLHVCLTLASVSDLDNSQNQHEHIQSPLLSTHGSTHDHSKVDSLQQASHRHEKRQVGSSIPGSATALLNNAPVNTTVDPGKTQHFVLVSSKEPRSVDDDGVGAELDRRQGVSHRVYVTINTCFQPTFKSKQDREKPPQLQLFVSNSPGDKLPGPDSGGASLTVAPLDEGYALVNITTIGDLYIGVYAPVVEIEGKEGWTYEIAASLDEPYHSYGGINTYVYLVDSDTKSALLTTKNMKAALPSNQTMNEWLETGPPLSIFVANISDPAINGLRYSFQGVSLNSPWTGDKLFPTDNGVELGLTSLRGVGLEEQFYVPGLQPTSTYYGFLARSGNGTASGPVPGGGGAIITYMNFTTKRDANCEVIYNLSFCDTVAYAVPANPSTFPDMLDLAALYDNRTQASYQNFNYSLQQIPCNTTDSAKYSLARTCEDCAAAYKTWLCAVSIPRCSDWSATVISHPSDAFYFDDGIHDNRTYSAANAPDRSHLQPRNVAQAPIKDTPQIKPVTDHVELDWLATNSSRNNATIAGVVQPGPYLEVLPCEDLCFDLVRSCPASFGFACPVQGKGLEASYGKRGIVKGGGVSCSEPGAVYRYSAAVRMQWSLMAMAVWLGVMGLMQVLWA